MIVQLIGSLHQLSILKAMIIRLARRGTRDRGVKIEIKSVVVIASVLMWTEVLTSFGLRMKIHVLLSTLVHIQVPLKLKYYLSL